MVKPIDQNAEHGTAPKNHKDRIMEHWKVILKDPESLQLKTISAPEKSAIYKATVKDHWYDNYSDVEFTPIYGHRICAVYNAKNSFGGYVGWKVQTFFIDRDGNFSAPTPTTGDTLSGMHSRGTFYSGMLITTSPCK